MYFFSTALADNRPQNPKFASWTPPTPKPRKKPATFYADYAQKQEDKATIARDLGQEDLQTYFQTKAPFARNVQQTATDSARSFITGMEQKNKLSRKMEKEVKAYKKALNNPEKVESYEQKKNDRETFQEALNQTLQNLQINQNAANEAKTALETHRSTRPPKGKSFDLNELLTNYEAQRQPNRANS